MVIKRERTNVRIELVKSMEWIGVLDMVYMAKDGAISKRSIKIRQVGVVSVRAYYYLRKSNRTFKIKKSKLVGGHQG